MRPIDFNVLAFIWLGFFFAVNMVTVGILIRSVKKKKNISDCSGAIIVPAFVLVALLSFMFGVDAGQVTDIEITVVLASAMFLMLWEYFAPKTKQAKKVEAGFIGAIMLVSFLFLPAEADFGGLPVPAVLAMVLAFLGWLWLMYAFGKMKEVSEVVISESSFIAFAVVTGAVFLAFMGKDMWGGIGVIAASLLIAVAGFRNWSKTVVWPKMTNTAIVPVALVLGWLLMKAAAGGMWVFALVVPMYFFAETGYVFIKKNLFKAKNPLPFAVKVVQNGAIVNGVIRAIFRSNIVLLMIALLGLTGMHATYLIILGAAFAIYELYKFNSWGEKQPSIREITKGLVQETKAGYQEQKTFFSKFFRNLKKKDTVKEALLATGQEMSAAAKGNAEEKAKNKPALKSAGKAAAKKRGRPKKAKGKSKKA